MPPVLALAGSAVAPVLGGLVGNAISSGGRDQATQMQNQILQEIQNLPTPQLQAAAFQQYKNAGTLTPELENLVNQGSSQMNNVMGNIDPRLMQAQMGALGKLQQLGKGGLQPADMAALSQIQRSSDQDAQAKSQQVLQDAQQRGEGGSGSSLASQLIGAQMGADRMASQNGSVGANVSQAALQALMQAGQMGGAMQGQQFGEQSQVAQAQDAINKFNAQNQQAVGNQNTQLSNYGQQYNLQNLQNVMNQNTGLANQQQLYNNQLQQQNYANQLGKLQGMTGQQNSMANQQQGYANQQANMWGGVGQAVGSGLGSYAASSAKPPAQAAASTSNPYATVGSATTSYSNMSPEEQSSYNKQMYGV